MFRSPDLPRQRIRNKWSTIPYKRFGRGGWMGRVGTKATGGLAKGVGFGASMVLLDAGIRGASKAINAGQVEEIDADQSHSTGFVVVNSKGDSEGSPIATYVSVAALIIFIIMTGPCFFKKVKRFLARGKKTAYPESANVIHPPGNFSIPRSAVIQDADIEKLRAENYRAICLDNAEKQARLTEALKRSNMEQEARLSRESMDPGIELPTIQSESPEDGTEDQESTHARET